MAPEPAGARRPGKMSLAGAESFSLSASIGGPRGLAESVIPYTVFSIVFGFTKDLQTSIISAVIPVVILTIWRLIARETLSQVISGGFGVALGAYLAHRSGNASDFFLPSIWKNTAFLALYVLSMLVRWPLIGVIVSQLTGEQFAWRSNRPRMRAYQIATGFWVGMFGLRLLVQVPLYLAGQVALLGTLNGLVLGLPLFALTIWLSWLVLRGVPLATPDRDEDDETDLDDDGTSPHPAAEPGGPRGVISDPA
jgi:hypothetical protein